MIEGNGRRHSMGSRGIPEDRITPEGYHRNGDFPTDRQSRDRSVRQALQFPSDFELHHQPEHQYPTDRSSSDKLHHQPEHHYPTDRLSSDKLHHQPEHHYPTDRSSSDKYQDRRGVPTRDQRPSDSRRQLHHSTSEQENSNSSSGDQRYLEQSEISQRPESITPEQKHRTRPREMYHESDSDVEDIMHIPTVSFLLTERGEPVEVRPGAAEYSLKIKPQQTGKENIKGAQLLPMMPVASTSEDMIGMRRKRNATIEEDEPKQKHFGREGTLSPGTVPDEREKEKYLFGSKAAGKSKISSGRRLDMGARKSGRFEGTSQSPSPDVGHWRYDSRDANLVRPERELPSSPSDPGFVRHTAHNWPESSPRTPSQSPVDSVTPGVQNWPESHSRTPSHSPQNWSGSAPSIHQGSDSRSRTPPQSEQDLSTPMSQTPSSHHVQWPQSNQSSDEGDYAAASPPPPPPSKPPVSHHQQASGTRQYRSAKQQQEQEEEEEDIDEDMPTGGSLTTQLLQKWLKQRKLKAGKSKSNP